MGLSAPTGTACACPGRSGQGFATELAWNDAAIAFDAVADDEAHALYPHYVTPERERGAEGSAWGADAIGEPCERYNHDYAHTELEEDDAGSALAADAKLTEALAARPPIGSTARSS